MEKGKEKFPMSKEALHHAYCISGAGETVCVDLIGFIETKLKIPTAGNPDFYHEAFITLGIDDARRLNEMQQRKSFSDFPKIFVVEAETLTVEAQNALLKMFEDPTPGTHFFLLVKSTDRLLPTLRSRLFVIEGDGGEVEGHDADDFLRMEIPERLAFTKKIADEVASKKKSKQDIFELCNGLEHILRKLTIEEGRSEYAPAAEEVLAVKGYLSDRAPSVKTLLDTLAINLPPFTKKRV